MTTSEATLPPTNAAPRRRRRWPVVVGVVATLLAALVIVSSLITVPYYELVPGQALAVSGLITVPESYAHTQHGNVLLTDVGVNSLRMIQVVPAWFDSDATIVARGQLTGNLPVSEFYAQGDVDMAESQLTAKAVALRQLGYEVPEVDAGVTVYVIDPSTPAWKALQVGDVITAIDGVATPNPTVLQTVVRRYKPGDHITLRVGSIAHPTPGRDVSITLASMKQKGVVEPLIGIGDPDVPGIAGMGTQPQYSYPLDVSISSDNIGGPSAGLAFTLGLIDKLTSGSITGGHIVAATGTIHPDGTVGDVGGVAQKTVAVERAGATLFLVPPQELNVARSKATPGLTVMAVSNLSQALADLERIGGTLGPAASGPPAGAGGHSFPTDWQYSPWT